MSQVHERIWDPKSASVAGIGSLQNREGDSSRCSSMGNCAVSVAEVYCRGCIFGLFEVDPIPGYHGFVESEPRLRAVPVDEFANGMIIRSLGTLGRQAVQDCRF